MASVNSFITQSLNSITKPIKELNYPRFNFSVKGLSGSSLQNFCKSNKLTNWVPLKGRKRTWVVVKSVTEEFDVIPVQSSDCTDQQDGVVGVIEREMLEVEKMNQVDVFVNEGELSFEGGFGEFYGFSPSSSSSGSLEGISEEKLIDKSINAAIVLAAGTFAITKLLTIDSDYWHGWTLYEIIRYAPQHNWTAYEEALKTNPVLAKMMISGVVYSVGDWIAQAGWKLWPFAHLITYGVIPLEQRLLWVDCVELVWVTILSTYSNEKSEARNSESSIETNSMSQLADPHESE